MNRSWTHKNIARSIQFGGIYPIYRVGKVHKALDTEKSKPSVASGGEVIQAYTPTRGGSWRNTKKIAVSWTINGAGIEHSISFFFKGVEYLLESVPANYHLRAVSLNKQFLILLFVTGSESNSSKGSPVLMRKYVSFLQTGVGTSFSEIAQAELSIPLATTGFTQDGRTFGGLSNGSTGYPICRFNPDFSEYAITEEPYGTGGVVDAFVDGLGFTLVVHVDDESFSTPLPTEGPIGETIDAPYEQRVSWHLRVVGVQPTWEGGYTPYQDSPTDWVSSTFFDNLLPEHVNRVGGASMTFYEEAPPTIEMNDSGTDQTLYLKNVIYSDTSGILVYTYGGGNTVTTGPALGYGTTSNPTTIVSQATAHEMVLVLDGATHTLKTQAGTNTQYFQDRFTPGLALPGSKLLYLRWAFPDPYGSNVYELHIDLETREFTFHEHPLEGSNPLALTTL